MQKRIIPVVLVIALLVSGLLSILSIQGLQGNARVINYTGVVRGATQRLIKQELNGQPNDALIERLNGILDELACGEGDNDLDKIEDDAYQALIGQMQTQWESLKEEIAKVREGAPGDVLYERSEDYFALADRTVSAAELYSERQVRKAEHQLFFLCAVSLLLAAMLAWYETVQAKRRLKLKEAEDANRIQSEFLARLSEDLRAPMDEISELMYVADPETYDLLFVNEAGRKTFGVTDLSGKKCYQVLQGLDSPCDFCTTPFLVPGENYTWEYTNPLTERHYLLKDRLLQWGGQPARLEIAFDITAAEAEKQALKQMLDAEQMVMECVRNLYREPDLNQSVPFVLERLGRFLAADRAYVLIEHDNLLYNDYEWCADGVASQRELLQGLPLSSIDCWRPAFDQQECAIMEDVESIREEYPETYELLRVQDIHSLVAAPLEQDGRLRGCVGVDNPPPERMRGIASLLQTLCYFLLLTYRRTENELQLSHLSYYDTLTSFYNRNRFIEDSEALKDSNESVGIVYLDVNGLKDINDLKGHAFGDKVLVECAKQMRDVFHGASYYRIGGDEFVIICPGIDRTSFDFGVSELRRRYSSNTSCNVAIGSQWDAQFKDLQQIIARADAAMYEDKKDFYRKNPYSNRYRHHSDEILHLSDPKILQNEIQSNHFVVYLQPKMSSSDRSIVGAEALIRYQPQSGSIILPGNFLPLLEEYQSISQIDFYVFEYACSQIKTWVEHGKTAFPLSVNFSRSSLSQPDFVSKVTSLCQKYGVDKRYLEIEITETSRDLDGSDLKSLIRDLREAGFVVSIDDFGTEYANLALLSSVDFDILKLDKSLVDDVARNDKARTVVESIVDICRKVQIQVVAEGIETEDQLAVLRECGVDLAQGFLLGRPIPIEEYEQKYLRS